MKKLYPINSIQPEKIISKFFYWGLALFIVVSLNFWNARGMYFIVGTSGKTLQIYANLMGIVYNISTIIIPIISVVLFKISCDILYLIITLLKDKSKSE